MILKNSQEFIDYRKRFEITEEDDNSIINIINIINIVDPKPTNENNNNNEIYDSSFGNVEWKFNKFYWLFENFIYSSSGWWKLFHWLLPIPSSVELENYVAQVCSLQICIMVFVIFLLTLVFIMHLFNTWFKLFSLLLYVYSLLGF